MLNSRYQIVKQKKKLGYIEKNEACIPYSFVLCGFFPLKPKKIKLEEDKKKEKKIEKKSKEKKKSNGENCLNIAIPNKFFQPETKNV